MKLTQKQVIEEIKMGKSLKDFPEWCDDEEVVLEAVEQVGWALQYASDRLKKELLPQVLGVFNYKGDLNPINIVKYYSDFLSLLTSEEQNNKTIVLEAVKQNGFSLEFASERLKKILLPKALIQLGYKGSINSIEIVKSNGAFLSLLTTEDKNNKEIVLKAVKQNKSSLVYASREIKDRIGNNDSIEFLERWIKSEELEQRLDKKGKSGKIKL